MKTKVDTDDDLPIDESYYPQIFLEKALYEE